MKPITNVILNPSLTDSPARVNMRTGEMEVSEGFFKLPCEFRVFILCHEYGHRMANTRDEKLADNIAFRFYANLGYPLSKAVLALAEILNHDSSYHISRAKAVYDLAQEFDQKIYQPHSDLNLQVKKNRLHLMRRHKNSKTREIAALIRDKKYLEAKQLLQSELKTMEPNGRLEKPYQNLVKLVDKAAGCLAPGQNKRPRRTPIEAGFNDDEHYSNFTDELAGFANELDSIAAFNDTFDAYVGEVEAIIEETQNFAGQNEIAEILGQDFAEIEGFSDDLADFTQEESEPVNPFVYASLKGKARARKEERTKKRDERKHIRLENKSKIVDAKVKVKEANAQAKVTKADAKKTLADQGISTGVKLDKNMLSGVLETVGGALNAGTGGALGAVGKMFGGGGGEPANVADAGGGGGGDGGGDQNLKTSGGIPTWVWIVGAVVVVAAIGAAAWFFTRPKKGTAKAASK